MSNANTRISERDGTRIAVSNPSRLQGVLRVALGVAAALALVAGAQLATAVPASAATRIAADAPAQVLPVADAFSAPTYAGIPTTPVQPQTPKQPTQPNPAVTASGKLPSLGADVSPFVIGGAILFIIAGGIVLTVRGGRVGSTD